ncbi:MAG TPA: hypothetical protein PK588_08660 [Paludibacteraceae bacterium]|nr:hypothetical protein [Paludibacteraceae bacterium]
MTVQEIRWQLERRKGQKQEIENNLVQARQELKELVRSLHRHEQAREIIQEVGIRTQQQISYHISDITSLALEAVFPEPYSVVLEFVRRRNKTECDIYFQQGTNRINNPEDASGGGVLDVTAFALRIASWSMQIPHSAPTIILDEPFKFLHSEEYNQRASLLLSELSKKLNIQFIIVTQESLLSTYADRIFEVWKTNKTSKVKIVDQGNQSGAVIKKDSE